MATLREKSSTARRAHFRVESLEGRILLAEAAAWLGQNNADYVGRDGRSPDGYQDIDIRLLGLDSSRAIDRVDVQRYSGGLWTATAAMSSQMVLVRDQNPATGSWSTEASLHLEPYFNDPAGFKYEQIRIKYSDGSTATINDLYSTTSVTVNLRVQGDELGVTWKGQDGPDVAGPGLTAGSDGVKDVHLALANLLDYRRASDGSRVSFDPDRDAVVVTIPASDGSTVTWLAGPRPAGLTQQYNRAEVFVNPADPSRADLYLNPVAGLSVGQTVTVSVWYNQIGKTDASPDRNDATSQVVAVVATAPDPTLAADSPQNPSMPISFSGPSAIWSGQDGVTTSTPGLVRLTLSNLPAGWAIAEAVLSNNIGQLWSVGNGSRLQALTVQAQTDPTRATLIFTPVRDESDSVMTLRFRLVGGSEQFVTQFHGGPVNLALRDPVATTTSITVDPSYVNQPGHDLNKLVKQYGTIHLKAGVYPLSGPLDLVNSVSLIAEPGAIFLFSQASDAPAWSYAIKVQKSHTTLDGLTIRFATPIRWTADFQMNPAVIGSTYSSHNFGPNPKVDLNIRNLDIAYAPPHFSGDNYNFTSVRLIRSNYDDSGVIANNILRGGPVEVWGGPWRIAGNDYQGAAAGSSVSPAFAVRNSHDVVVEGNHAHQVEPTGITYSFLLFTGSSSNTTVRNNIVNGGFGRDAAVSGGQHNFPELILSESYYPEYEGPALVSPTSRRLLQVATLRGGPGKSGDVVAILSGPSAGRWVRISQAIDSQNYLLDGDLPEGNYTISITRGFVNEVYEGNTLDTSSLQKSSSVAFQLAGARFNTIVRNNLVVGARPFLLSSVPTQNSYPGSTPYPAPWGWTHLPVFDLQLDGNTFRDPVLWVPSTQAGQFTRTVAEGTLAVEHGGLIRENQGRLYLSGSVTDNHFTYSDAFLAGTTGDFTSIRIGASGAVDPNEMRLTHFSGNTATVPASFTAAGRKVVIRFESGTLAGQTLEPVQALPGSAPAYPPITALTLNQDGFDRVGRSATPGPDGLQDVHIVLAGLRTDMAIRTIDIYPYGSGYFQYAAPGIPQNTPGINPGAWRVGVTRELDGPVHFSARADLYVQPYTVENGRNHWDIIVTYANGTTAFVSVFGVQVADPSLKVGSLVSKPTATSLGQDQSDFVGTSPTLGPDGYQDIHLVLSGLPSNKAIAQVDVLPYGYGHYQYVSPLAPPLPDPHPGIPNRDFRNWRAAFVQATFGLGSYATTADLYIPSIKLENGIQPGTNIANHYDVIITFADGTSISTAAWGVVGNPGAKVVGLAAQSYGQDGQDLVGPSASPQGDGVQDLHIGLTGLRTDQQVTRVEVWAIGGGEWTYQGTTDRPAATLIRASNGPGSFAPTGDLYMAPNANFVGSDGILKPQTLHLLVYYADGSTSQVATLPGITANPNLLKPVATSLNQDGHDLARASGTKGSDGQQDVHIVLSNLPTDSPLARVVVRRLGSGETYQSDGSNNSWLAVTTQGQTGPGTYASTADIYFQPGPNVVDVNQQYQIEIYLGDTSRKPIILSTTVNARPGPALAAPTTVESRTIQAASQPSPVLAAMPVAQPTPVLATQPVAQPTPVLVTQPVAQPTPSAQHNQSTPLPKSPVPTALGSTTRSRVRKVPVGPLGHRQPKVVHRDVQDHSTEHRPFVKRAGVGPRAMAALKASIRRNLRKG